MGGLNKLVRRRMNNTKNIILIICMSIFISCNNDKEIFNSYNSRIQNISILSQSFKNSENDYLKILIDSSKILTNDINHLEIKLDMKKKLIDSIQRIEKLIKANISNNCIIGKTFFIFLNGDNESFDVKLICEIDKHNVCTISTKLMWKVFEGEIENIKSGFAGVTTFDLFYYNRIKNKNIRDVVRKGRFQTTFNQTDFDTFEILPIYPLKIKVKDLNECECELTKEGN